MMANTHVSIVIVNYNGGEYILRCVESVLKCHGNEKILEVIIVDNGSKDGSPEAISKFFANESRVKLALLGKNLGFANASNIGFRLAKGRYCAFLNQDTMVQDEWLQIILETFASDDSIVIVQPLLLQMSNPKLIDSSGGFIDCFCIAHEESGTEINNLIVSRKTIDIFYAKGAALVLDRLRLPWRNMVLFDDDFFMYCEDVDLCWRLRLTGRRIVLCPQSRVLHTGGLQIRGIDPCLIFHHEKNRFLTMVKNFDLMNAAIYGTLVTLSQMFLSLYFLQRRESLKAKAVLSALLWNVLNIKTTWRKKSWVQRHRNISDAIIKQYMVRFNPIETARKLKVTY